jgi:hypothetical protein
MSIRGSNYKKIEDMVSSDPAKMYIKSNDKKDKKKYNMFNKIYKMFKYISDDDSDTSEIEFNKINISVDQGVRIINNYVDNDKEQNYAIEIKLSKQEIKNYRLIEYPNEEFLTGDFHNNFNVNDYAFASNKCSVKINKNEKYAICTLSSMLLCGSFYFIINPL